MHPTPAVIAALAGLLLVGCTASTTPPVMRVTPTSSVTAAAPTSAGTVKVTLHIESTQPAIIRYSNGVTTKMVDMALEGNGDAGTMEITFDAPQPYLAVATIVTSKPGKLVCNMDASGPLDPAYPNEVGSLGGTGSTVKNGTFAMCRSIVDRHDPGKGAATDHLVQLKTKASGDNDWMAWASTYSSGEDVAAGSSTVKVGQPAGPVRLVVVATKDGDKVSCSILAEGGVSVGESSDAYGDIVNCSHTVGA